MLSLSPKSDILTQALASQGISYLLYDLSTGAIAFSEDLRTILHPVDNSRLFERLEEFLHPHDRPILRAALYGDLSVEAERSRLRFFDPTTGAMLWLTCSTSESENPHQRLVLLQDATDQVRTEERLDLLNGRLETAVQERVGQLELAYQKLHRETEERRQAEEGLRQLQKMDALGQLTGGIAHDFNNLLQAMISYLSLAEQQATSETGLKAIRGAREAADRSSKLVKQLLAFARRQELEAEAVHIPVVLDEAQPLFEQALGRNISLQMALAKDLWPAFADPTQLLSTVVNLAINARDAMPQGGTLSIQVENCPADAPTRKLPAELEPGDYVCLSVTDTGTGMPPEVISRAFEPFFTTKDRGRGTGLGLSMVYGMSRQLGGSAAISSELGQGTTVSLFLRRAH